MNINEILEASTPRTQTVSIPVRGDLVAKQHELEEELRKVIKEGERSGDADSLGSSSGAKAAKLAEEIRLVEEEANKFTFDFNFKSIGLKAWSDLEANHPPTVKQKEEARKAKTSAPGWNPETFPFAAIAASCFEPDLTVDDVKKIYEKWNFPDFQKLFMACLDANMGDNSVPLSSIASMTRQGSEKKSEQLLA